MPLVTPPAPSPSAPFDARPTSPAAPAPARDSALVAPGAADRLTWALLALTVPTAGATALLGDDVLLGPAVQNGSARGTALVMVLVCAAVSAATVATSRGVALALPVWLGGLAYLVYNAAMLLFATPFNLLFLPTVAAFSLAIWALVATVRATDVAAVDARFSPGLRPRWVCGYVWVVVALNTLAWLYGIVPALSDPASAAFLEGTGLTTNPGYVQDLAIWLPLAAVAAVWLWQGRPAGRLAVPSMLVLWVAESIGIAVDQWWGHAADPTSPVASATMTPVFLAAAVVGLLPLVPFARHLCRR